MEHVCRLFRSSPKKRAQRVTRDRPDQPSVRPSFFSSFLPLFSPLFSLFSPSPHPLITQSFHLPILSSSLFCCSSSSSSREKKRNSPSPLFPLNGQFFFFAVRYWARQLGNRRHFRTVQAKHSQPTSVPISAAPTPVHSPSNQPTLFFSPHRTRSLLFPTRLKR